MTQAVFNDIDPNVKSGTELATDLNNFKASLLTQHSGPSAPTYAEIGTEWLDSAVTDTLTRKIYDGAQWVTVYTLDTSAHIIFYGGNNPTAAFSIERTDTAADLLELYRNNQTEGSGGIIFTQRNSADVKKTMAKLLLESNSLTNGAEEAQLSLQTMLAGTLTEIFSVNKDQMYSKFLEGIGERVLVADSAGNVSSKALSTDANLLLNGDAETGDDTAYTATTLVFTKSTTSTELIEGSQVFKAVSSGASETLESEVVTLKNGHKTHPIILEFQYKCSTEWDIEILDQLDATLVSEKINPFTPVGNEANVKKMFVVIPNATTTIKFKMTSSAADTLLFDKVKFISLVSQEEILFFERDLANNQTNTNLFDIARTKNKAYKVEARIARETDTNYAEAIVEFFISYDQSGLVWRVAKETVNDLEAVDTNITFNMSTNTLQYSSDDLTGANYTGKINGKITRLL